MRVRYGDGVENELQGRFLEDAVDLGEEFGFGQVAVQNVGGAEPAKQHSMSLRRGDNDGRESGELCHLYCWVHV